MAVKVLIKRKFKEGKAREVFALLNKFRVAAMDQPGYISGETLIGHDDPRQLLVISMWENFENWQKWREDPARKANEANLQQYLEEPTAIEAYIFGTIPHRTR